MVTKGWDKQRLDVEIETPELSSKSWLANGIELLFERRGLNKHGKPFDVVIVGSGYGGSIAANELSKAAELGLSICLLERGREFLPGTFPNSMDEAPTELRYSPKCGAKPVGNLEGLIDTRLGEDLNIVQANGLGGGSLINAGVMARAEDAVFDQPQWPKEITANSLRDHYQEMEVLLGARNKNKDGSINANTIFNHSNYIDGTIGPAKFESLKRLAQSEMKSSAPKNTSIPASFKRANITVNMQDGHQTVAGVSLNACNLCGDCASGCNNNSKISLDKNLLVLAAQQGVEIFTGATALQLREFDAHCTDGDKQKTRWQLDVVYTDTQLRSRQSQPFLTIDTHNIILSAGALGSTEILQRSGEKGLKLSPTIGSRFSSNGDMLAVGFNQSQPANAIANSSVAHSDRHIGPTITGMIDLRNSAENIVIQEMAVPAAASHLFTELFTTVNSFRGLWDADNTAHVSGNNFVDPIAMSNQSLNNSSLYAVMGDDDAEGKLELEPNSASEGTIQIKWKSLRNHDLFGTQIDTLNRLSGKLGNGLGGKILPNPVWQLLKPHYMKVLKLENGPPLSVHPLGGCPMADDARHGVTDHLGRVYKAGNDNKQTYEGLIVLDGAIIPGAVGINPALTISAISLRAIRELLAADYFTYRDDEKPGEAKPGIINRIDIPVVRDQRELESLSNKEQIDTEIEITERLIGKTQLENDAGNLEDVVIELTLWSKPIEVKTLSKMGSATNASNPVVEIDSTKQNPVVKQPLSKLRIYRKQDWHAIRAGSIEVDKHEVALDHAAQFIGRISGRISLFNRDESYPLSRRVESFYAWRKNRGWRDIYQHMYPKKWEESNTRSSRSFWTYLRELLRTFDRAGEIRTLNYDITIAQTIKSDNFSYFGPQSTDAEASRKKIIGRKYLHYTRRSNPWIQLSQVHLESVPAPDKTSLFALPIGSGKPNTLIKNLKQRTNKRQLSRAYQQNNSLYLDTNYLTKVGVPLIQVSAQENQVKALEEMSSFSTYVLRMLVGIHFYSFRAPDNSRPRIANRKAKAIPDLPIPEPRTTITVDRVPDSTINGLNEGDAVNIELLHYKHRSPKKPPVLMIHGYSASSTSFAHHSVPNGLAKYFFNEGRDIWLVDLRTSSALASARYPWKFESIAEQDIPTAVSHIYDYYDQSQKIDVITHCMGSVMLGMSILSPHENDDNFFKNRLNRIVFSQATPTITFSADNNLRAFATKYLKELVPDDYQFQVNEDPLSANTVQAEISKKSPNTLLDRLLYTLPYPRREFDLLNPKRRPWSRREFARTRHRMDAFFSRTFELGNISDKTLHYIDDFFGPIHVDTIIQASRFADNEVVTNVKGFNSYVSKESLKKYWGKIPTMSFHSINNGLVDFSTGKRTQRIFKEAGVPYETVLIEDTKYGHQDAIIGPNAHQDIFPHISTFLDNTPTNPEHDNSQTCEDWGVETPKHGPILIHPKNDSRQVLKVMLGGNPARACQPYILFVPVVRVADRLEVAGDNAEHKSENLSSYISHSLSLQESIENHPITRWNVVELPDHMMFDKHHGLSNAEGLACMLVYDDLIELCPKTIFSQDYQHYLSSINQNHVRAISKRERPVAELSNELENVISNFLDSPNNNYYELSDSIIERESLKSYAANTPLSFAFGSCQYPAGIIDKHLAYHSYQKLNQAMETKQSRRPDFIALLGDQIYADATAGFLDPSAKFDKFVQPYYRLYENTHVRTVLRKVPIFAMLDDHEICDNWEPLANPKANAERQQVLDTELTSGVKSFLQYQRGEFRPETNWNPKQENLWYTFSRRGFEFFMCDTRTKRSARTAENILNASTTLLGPEQEEALENWLTTKSNQKTKFVLSSSMILPRHKVLHGSYQSPANAIRSDSWGGYPVSLHKTLALLVDNDLNNIVFLSGDEHIACFATIEITDLSNKKKANAYSIHCPGLYTPLPFANGRVDDFEGETAGHGNFRISTFEFSYDNKHYRCQTKAYFDLNKLDFNGKNHHLGPVNIEQIGGFLQISVN